MAKLAGRKSLLKCSGTAVTFIGEAVSTSDNTKYQITDTSKRVLDRTAAMFVHRLDGLGDYLSVATTNTTTVTFGSAHNLEVNDLVYNIDRDAYRLVLTTPTSTSITVDSVTSQTAGDEFNFYPTETTSDYELNRLSGYFTYGSATSRTILVSGSYLPLTTIGEAYEFTLACSASNEDCTVFSDTFVERLQTIKDVTLSVSKYYVDSEFQLKLIDGSPIMVEIFIDSSSDFYAKVWCLPSSDEVSSSVDGIVEESLELEGTLDADSRAITYD